MKPLHAIAKHQWNPRNVLRFFTALAWALTGLVAWDSTITNDPLTGHPPWLGGIALCVILGLAALVLSGVMIWQYEERKPTKETREERLREMERELGLDEYPLGT